MYIIKPRLILLALANLSILSNFEANSGSLNPEIILLLSSPFGDMTIFAALIRLSRLNILSSISVSCRAALNIVSFASFLFGGMNLWLSMRGIPKLFLTICRVFIE